MSDCKWEVGKTYRTTLPGVTATITYIGGDDVIGDISNRTCRAWRWCKVDGKFRTFKNSQEHPHLTTELADEPQVETVNPEPVECVTDKPKLRATIDTRNGRWVVIDSLRPGMFASFGRERERAESACDLLNSGDDCSALCWSFDEPPVDVINAPPHYNQGEIECIDAIQAALSPEEFRGALRFNVLKYVWRCNHKNGIEDVRKATYYLKRLEKEMIRGECVSHGGNGCEKEGGES